MILLVYISTLQHTQKQVCNHDFAKGEGLEVKTFFLWKNAVIGWQAEQSAATKSSHKDGGLGVKPRSLCNFFFEKK